MKITHIVTKGRPMGGTQVDTFMCLDYQRASHDVEVVMGSDGPLAQACERAGIAWRVVRIRNRFVDPLNDIRVLVSLVRHLRHRRPDIVHTHSSKVGLLGRIAARLAGVPVVVHTLHVLPYHDRQPAPLRGGLVLLERLLSRITSHVVSVSGTMRDDFLAKGVCTPDMLTVIGSAIDFSVFLEARDEARRETREGLGIPSHSPVVISVANLEPRKRYDVFVAAAAAVVREVPDAMFLIAGVGEMEGAIRRQIERLGLQRQVLLLGKRDDVPRLLAASDVFIQTSQLEGLSRSLLEAMYSGLPVVATDTNGTREVVADGETGLLVVPGDAQELVELLLPLLGDEVERRRLGDAAHRAVTHDWSVDAVGQAHERLYARLHARHSVGRTPAAYTSGSR